MSEKDLYQAKIIIAGKTRCFINGEVIHESRLFCFALSSVALFLIVGCSQSETEIPNSNESNDAGESSQVIDSNAPLSLENLHGMFYGFRDDFGLIGINAGASSKTQFLVLNSDAIFEISGVTLGSIGAMSGGTSTSASSSSDIDSGMYEVENNTIIFTGNDGSVRNVLFFLHDGDVNDIQLGEKTIMSMMNKLFE